MAAQAVEETTQSTTELGGERESQDSPAPGIAPKPTRQAPGLRNRWSLQQICHKQAKTGLEDRTWRGAEFFVLSNVDRF